MQDLSLKSRIHRYLNNHAGEWINGGEFERKALELGYKASNASRRLRELHEEGLIDRDEKASGTGKKSVWYRCSQPQLFIHN